MSLDPILNASLVIQLHVIAALCAVIVGPLVLFRRSRDAWHKRLGYVWVIAMAGTALSSFGISEAPVLGPLSPIHALSFFTLWSLWYGIKAARQGRIAAHQKEMRSIYFWALGIAGIFTFLPGRRMNAVVFGDASMFGFLLMGGLISAGLVYYHYANQKIKGESKLVSR
jgi:uncharacterized membrane protein